MATYNGNAGAITAHLAPSVTVPTDGDPVNGAITDPPSKTLADFVAYLQANALLLDAAARLVSIDRTTGAGNLGVGATTADGINLGRVGKVTRNKGFMNVEQDLAVFGDLEVDTGLIVTGGAEINGLLTANDYILLNGNTAAPPQNTLTAAAVPKVWANFSTNGAGGVTQNNAMNVAALQVLVGGSVRITFIQPFTGTYTQWASADTFGGTHSFGFFNKTTSIVEVALYNAGGLMNLNTTAVTITFGALGRQ